MTQSTMLYSQGDVVLVAWPFTNGQATKKRPAVVLSCSWYNCQPESDLVLAAISSSIPSSLPQDHFKLSQVEEKDAGLLKPSIVRAGKLFTIHQSKILHKLGKLPPASMVKVIGKVNEILQP